MDNGNAIQHARQIDHPASLILALMYTSITHVFLSGDYASASLSLDELVALADKTGALFWKGIGTLLRSYLIALTGEPSRVLPLITANVATLQSSGVKMFMPLLLDYAARAYLDAEQFDAARNSIQEATIAVQSTGEKWIEAEVHRTAGEIALKSPEHDVAKAEAHFERSLALARQQQAKSWELRAATSLARLWCVQGKVQQARELLAPVCGWFTEGFDTRDLKEAKALLGELAA
jgi:predicted ATPase